MKLAQKFALAYIRTRLKIISMISPRRAAKEAFTLFCTPQYRHNKPLTDLFEKANKLNFRFGEYDISGFSWNTSGTKRILIAHGFESSAANFEHYIAALIEKNCAVFAVDAPAHGRSSGKQVNALVYKQLLTHLHETYGPFDGSLGHSFGGLALSLAVADLPPDPNYRMVLIAPATETTTVIRQFLEFVRLRNPKVKQHMINIIHDLSGQSLEWFSVKRALTAIPGSVVWVHDTMDDVTPFKDAEAILEYNLPNVEFMATTGLGHRKIYRDALVGARVIAFLTEDQ